MDQASGGGGENVGGHTNAFPEPGAGRRWSHPVGPGRGTAGSAEQPSPLRSTGSPRASRCPRVADRVHRAKTTSGSLLPDGLWDVGQGKTMAPETGLEPVTRRLTAGCSTIELLWNLLSEVNLSRGRRGVNGVVSGMHEQGFQAPGESQPDPAGQRLGRGPKMFKTGPRGMLGRSAGSERRLADGRRPGPCGRLARGDPVRPGGPGRAQPMVCGRPSAPGGGRRTPGGPGACPAWRAFC